jgi:hypothetical protein
LSRSQSRTNSHLELEREERRVDEEMLAWMSELHRDDIIEEAYDAGLVTDGEYYLAADIREARRSAKGGHPKTIFARSNARKAKYQCSGCGDPVYAKARCRSCYDFQRKHKRDRTPDEVAQNTYAQVARRTH